jgi:glycine/serine hydroxymethyltransferase
VDIVSGGTDSHLMLVDLRPMELTGKAAEAALGRAHITCNKNGVPFDPKSPVRHGGVRPRAPRPGTTRGFGVRSSSRSGRMIVEVLEGLQRNPDGRRADRKRRSRPAPSNCAAASRSTPPEFSPEEGRPCVARSAATSKAR